MDCNLAHFQWFYDLKMLGKPPKFSMNFALKYTIFGVFFGLLFPLMAYTIDFWRMDLSLSWENFVHIHSMFPIHFIIESAPVILGVMAYLCGRAMDKIQVKNHQIQCASNYKDDFLSSMSHEIRTPMSGIIGVLDLLDCSSNLGVKEREYIGIIQKSSKDLMRIINDILDLSKLRSGKFAIEKKESNIRDICNHIKNLFLAISKSKNMDLLLDIAPDVPNSLVLDPVRIKQVLSNLVGNALKFSDSGSVKIKVSFTKLPNNGKLELKFEVIDCGKGIAKEKIDSLFSPYQQLKMDGDITASGTGLGLHICKSLVELMGGEIGIESQIGKGSNFWFTTIASSVKDGENRLNLIVPEKENNNKLDLHILLADDNKTLCKVYQKMLNGLGCQTVITNNGIEALSAFKEDLYDIILLDINMPEMDGLETMNQIRERFHNIPPIICATASALKGDVDGYMDAGFDDYITKPFTVSDLFSILNKWGQTSKPNPNPDTFVV